MFGRKSVLGTVGKFIHYFSGFFMNNSKIKTQCFGESITEVYMEYIGDGILFHAHPNHNSFGECYDWVILDFAAPDDDQDYAGNAEDGYSDQNIYPAKILCFLKASDDSVHAVVNCCEASRIVFSLNIGKKNMK